jgi:hypothetical protein
MRERALNDQQTNGRFLGTNELLSTAGGAGGIC